MNKSPKKATKWKTRAAQLFDLEVYTPFLLTAISNKITSSASRIYINRFGIGIVEWRSIVTLAVFGQSTANDICRLVGLDKSAVSRALKNMETEGYISPAEGTFPGRSRPVFLTQAGQDIYEEILGIALKREKALLSCLKSSEMQQLTNFLQRIHENLPNAIMVGEKSSKE